MKSYDAARKAHDSREFWARVIIGIGLIGTVLGIGLGREFGGIPMAALGALPGIVLYMQGTSALVSAQNGRAMVDTAEHTQLSLKVARDQLEISKELLSLSRQGTQSTSPTTGSAIPSLSFDTNEPAANDATALVHLGRSIAHTENGYEFEGQTFANLDAAKQHVENTLERQTAPLVASRDAP